MSVGTFCLVLHSHLPWVAHHGTWPVGEEWLHQAWAHAYGPVFEVFNQLALDGFRNIATIGVTPILAAQLDDPHCIAQHDIWLADWQLRAVGRASEGTASQRAAGHFAYQQATLARERFSNHWSRGGSSVIRPLLDAGVIDVLGGPATHPFQPLLQDEIIRAGLQIGQADARWRYGQDLPGIWAPECGYAPGLATQYAREGIEYFLVDGPTLASAQATTAVPWIVDDTVVFGRDLEITYRVWSPRKGYPGGKWYQDFHTYDHDWGLKSVRVTSGRTPPEHKAPYEPVSAQAAVQRDAQDFVGHVVRRLQSLGSVNSNPIVVAAFDTELFGHWWHEGPQFLNAILRMLPDAGVRVDTLRNVRHQAHDVIELPAGSWGSGKDWRVWDGAQVQDIVDLNAAVQREFLHEVARLPRHMQQSRIPYLDDALHQLLLTLSSDWAFMITKDSAAQYARQRATFHAAKMREILKERRTNASSRDRPFGYLDARILT